MDISREPQAILINPDRVTPRLVNPYEKANAYKAEFQNTQRRAFLARGFEERLAKIRQRLPKEGIDEIVRKAQANVDALTAANSSQEHIKKAQSFLNTARHVKRKLVDGATMDELQQQAAANSKRIAMTALVSELNWRQERARVIREELQTRHLSPEETGRKQQIIAQDMARIRDINAELTQSYASGQQQDAQRLSQVRKDLEAQRGPKTVKLKLRKPLFEKGEVGAWRASNSRIVINALLQALYEQFNIDFTFPPGEIKYGTAVSPSKYQKHGHVVPDVWFETKPDHLRRSPGPICRPLYSAKELLSYLDAAARQFPDKNPWEFVSVNIRMDTAEKIYSGSPHLPAVLNNIAREMTRHLSDPSAVQKVKNARFTL